MMKLLKKSLLIPTCLTLLTASSQAALVLEFREVGGTQVELSFTGSVNINGSFIVDTTNGTNIRPRLQPSGIFADVGGPSNNLSEYDLFSGDDLFNGVLANTLSVDDNGSIGLLISGRDVYIGVGLDGSVAFDRVANVSVLDAGAGGVLAGKTQTFNTTFAASGLDAHPGDTLIDLWRVSGTTGTDNLIQFRVNASSVPEPSSILMSGLGLLTLVTRRKRKA